MSPLGYAFSCELGTPKQLRTHTVTKNKKELVNVENLNQNVYNLFKSKALQGIQGTNK